ncbi:MAG: TonB-dependent receptor [Ignavibacteriae bacterium]|nr:TonB-dependent receptor [Ignavibacteriota bacterium]
MNSSKLLTVVLLSIVLISIGLSQDETGAIGGQVLLDDSSSAAGASVTLEETKVGIATKDDGSFLITNIPVGTYKLSVRLIGYEQGELLAVRVNRNDTTRVQIELRQSDIELGQVLVTGTRRQAAGDVRPSVTTMTPREAKYLPGAAEDVLRSLQALPGVTSVSDFSSQLIVRGSGPDQNLVMIDGFEVINPYRLYGVVSMFNPETVSDISLQTGGFTAQYGDRLSAVIDVKNREGRGDVPFGAKLNFSLTNMNLIFEGALPMDGASYLLSLRRTYYDLILGPVLKSAKLVQGDVALPNFRDLQFKAGMPLGESNRLIVNALTSRDGASLISGAERDRADSVSLFDASYNTMFGATWQFTPSDKVIINTQLSWYRNEGSGSFDGTFVDPSQNTGSIGRGDTLGVRFVSFAVDYGYKYDKTSLLQRWLINAGSHTVEAGYGADFLRTAFTRFFDIDQDLKNFIAQRGFIVPSDETESVPFGRYNVWVQDRISFGDRLFIQPGVRMDYYPFIKKKVYVAPRLNISYKLNEATTLRAAYGRYFQSPGMEKQNFGGSVTYSDASFKTLVAETAEHFIVGMDRMVTPTWQFKAEAYCKSFDDLAVAEKLQGSRWYSAPTGDSIFSPRGWTTPVRVPSDSLTPFPVNDATGQAYGFEVMLQKIRSLPTDKFTGWISYALSYAERERDGLTTPFLFDQRHAMNIVGDYKFAESWDLGLRYTLRSGRPFNKALGVKPRVVVVVQNGVETPYVQTDLKGKVTLDVDYERDAYSSRLDMYHSLDLRLTTYPGWWGLDWSIYLDVQNVLNRKNVQQQNYYIDNKGNLKARQVNGIPIFPSLGMSVVF